MHSSIAAKLRELAYVLENEDSLKPSNDLIYPQDVFGVGTNVDPWGGHEDDDTGNSDAREVSKLADKLGYTYFAFDGMLCERTGIGDDWKKIGLIKDLVKGKREK